MSKPQLQTRRVSLVFSVWSFVTAQSCSSVSFECVERNDNDIYWQIVQMSLEVMGCVWNRILSWGGTYCE